MNASEKVGLALVGTSIENAIKSLAAHVDAEIAALRTMIAPAPATVETETAPEPPPASPSAEAATEAPVEETENAG